MEWKDLLLVAVFHMGTDGAAIATVFAQAINVIISLLVLRRQQLPCRGFSRPVRPRGHPSAVPATGASVGAT